MNDYVGFLRNQVKILNEKIKNKQEELNYLNELLIEYKEELREKEDYQRLEDDE